MTLKLCAIAREDPDQDTLDIQGQFECGGPVQSTADALGQVSKANLS